MSEAREDKSNECERKKLYDLYERQTSEQVADDSFE